MKNKFIVSLIIFVLVVAGVLVVAKKMKTHSPSSQTVATSQTKKLNLILISIDGLQAKHLDEYGYPLHTTPNLDAFLNQSSLFTNAVSAAPWTVPSHMAVFTSMYPSEHKVINKFSDFDLKTQKGVVSNLKKLSPNAMTLAEILKAQGYTTGGFTGDSGVGKQFGFDQGFDTYYDGQVFGGFDQSVPRALDWLKQNKDKPFFLFLHGYDVHGQHAPVSGFDYRYVTKPYTGKYTGSIVEQGKLREEGLANGSINLSPEDVAFWRAIYDEKINRTDLEFKDFMDQVTQMGVLENTVVVVMSDHGTEFYEHKRFDHGFTLYDEVLDVLFAIHQPGQTQGQKINQLVSTFDILPTALDLLGIKNPVPQQTKGTDLVPSFSGTDVSHNVFSETDYRLYTFKRSITTPDGWVFILTLDSGAKELYNLTSDPTEQVNIVNKNPQKAYQLEQVLRKHIDETGGQRSSSMLGCSPVYSDQCK